MPQSSFISISTWCWNIGLNEISRIEKDLLGLFISFVKMLKRKEMLENNSYVGYAYCECHRREQEAEYNLLHISGCKRCNCISEEKENKKSNQSFFKKISAIKEQIQCFYWRTDSIFKSYSSSARTDKLSTEFVYIVALFRAAFHNRSFQSLISELLFPELESNSRAWFHNCSFQSLITKSLFPELEFIVALFKPHYIINLSRLILWSLFPELDFIIALSRASLQNRSLRLGS